MSKICSEYKIGSNLRSPTVIFFSDNVTIDFNVLGTFMKDLIGSDLNGGLVVKKIMVGSMDEISRS